VISAIKTQQIFYLKLIKQHFIMTEKNLDNMNRNQRQHNAESNLREQNPESREHFNGMHLQCTACPPTITQSSPMRVDDHLPKSFFSYHFYVEGESPLSRFEVVVNVSDEDVIFETLEP